VIGSFSGALFFTSILITALLLRLSPRPVRLQDILLILVFGLATMSALRMLYWWALMWPWVVAPHAAAAWGVSRRRARDADPATSTRTLIALLMAFLALVWGPPTYSLIVGQPRSEAVLADRDTPVFVADEIARRGLEGRIFAPMDWADYLVFKTHGAVQPLVHSHVHLVSAGAWDDYQALAEAGAGWLQIIDHYNLKYLVVRRTSRLGMSKYVWGNPRCRIIYQDQQAILMEVLPETKQMAAR
jgi:hypothetical protein